MYNVKCQCRSGFGGITKPISGESAVLIANIVKNSLDFIGKMEVDDIGDVTVTRLLEVEHPVLKILVELAQLHDEEVSHGTTSVVILASELLKNAHELVKQKIHRTSIISGYRLACNEGCKYLLEHLIVPVDKLDKACLQNVAKTFMSSIIIGADSNFFTAMVDDNEQTIKILDPEGNPAYPVEVVNFLKVGGKSARESVLIRGYALNCTVASQQMPKKILNAKIACLDFPLQKMEMGVQVLVSDPEKLEGIRARELDNTKERIDKIMAIGVNVILTSGDIDDLYLKNFVEAGVMAVRRVELADLNRIAKATGAAYLTSLTPMEGEESFEATMVGEAAEVVQEMICDDEFILIKGPKARTAASIILRGPNENYCDEMERSVYDALCVLKRVVKAKKFVAGGGSVEAALSIYLENFAISLGSSEQLAIAEFANSLLVIPKTLAVNAAKDATDYVAKLRAFHNSSQTKLEHTDLKWCGLYLIECVVKNKRKAGVLEPAMSKIKSLKLATEAAITILRWEDEQYGRGYC
ncbi:T-complex protein 1 subunit alpha-like [Bradysia coprophila]|uniref:T-complex protein 1 subunit alpha-like n=1 Tax=Bradysia coprophila TaxID=38358 RepID=UPI00187DBA31|nr:T-complex protein 1 subunit alpha-like [Bradysia coprophila]